MQVNDECKAAFNDIKLAKIHKYVVFCLSEDLKEIKVAKKAELGEFVHC